MGYGTDPAEVAHLSAPLRRMLRAQCGGDWSRVTVDTSGVTVHNSPQPNGIGAPPVPLVTPSPTVPMPAPQTLRARRRGRVVARGGIGFRPAPPDDEEPALLRNPVEPVPTEPEVRPTPEPPFRLTPMPTRAPVSSIPERFQRIRAMEPAPPSRDEATKFVLIPGVESAQDWKGIDLDESAYRLCERVRGGIDERAPLAFHDDVALLHGVDLEMVASVVRHPDRVEVAPETRIKGYPILKFHRADVMIVVGFLDPALPKIIFALWSSLLTPKLGSPRSVTGGGGARKRTGLPTRPSQLLARLREAGAVVAEPTNGSSIVAVTFRDLDLGKIDISDTVTRSDVESSWQRLLRRIEGIQRREEASG